MRMLTIIFFTVIAISCNERINNDMNDINTLTYLALGDSYTIGESVGENERWPVQLKDSLGQKAISVEDPVIIATTGWRTDQLKAALGDHDKYDYDVVSLLIGVNNQYQGKDVQGYYTEFEELLNLAVDRADGDKSRVFVVSIPDYGYTPFGKNDQERISRELDEYNTANLEITRSLGIRYFDITGISREGFNDPTLVANDGLHPSGKQYSLWVAKMMKDEDFLKQLMSQVEKN